jgi:hypothetical protein
MLRGIRCFCTGKGRVGRRLQFVLGFCFFLLPIFTLPQALSALSVSEIEQVYGERYEVIRNVTGRPWVEFQHRYTLQEWTINCYFVGNHCLWMDFMRHPGQGIVEADMFAELSKLFADQQWEAKTFHGRPRWWFNAMEDRVTLRATGFTLHMNDFIRNVLSRREQWQF